MNISNERVITITPNLFNSSSDIMFIEHRTRAIASSQMFEPFANLAYIERALRKQWM